MNKIDKDKLNQFVYLIQNVLKKPNQTFDLGLIIKESKSEIVSDTVFNALKEIINIEKIIYDESILDEDVILKMIESFKKNNWLFLEIKKDIGSLLLNQLKHLVNFNNLQIINFNNQDVFQMKMPHNSRIIIFSERNFIENKISYPHFYNLFGPVLNI